MKRYNRIEKPEGSGSGKTFYQSKLCTAMHWEASDWKEGKVIVTRYTEVRFPYLYHISDNRGIIYLDKHRQLKSDADCLAQLEGSEIEVLLEQVKQTGIHVGEENIRSSLRSLIGAITFNDVMSEVQPIQSTIDSLQYRLEAVRGPHF